ncbi:ThuA domain-containing protein [Chryseolinea sp. H1M3-3]|uniref:ThuA domain-containing protein n=1 Tax=Chryseolinea sp. H1M3-3 TaxID=3034144 RepID=UPI0023EDA05C|nr:ThuA domain-containing protein [Chryseolinea sp. H1M3-3]
MKKFPFFIAFLLMLCVGVFAHAQKNGDIKWKNVKVLVYTKNGKGYVHDNIESAVKAIEKLGKEKGFSVVASNDAAVFTEDNLKQYTFLLFANTNNDVFDTNDQRLAFRKYIEAGGGFVGLHSVLGTERNWTWFKMMLGGSFAWHPKFQPLSIKVIDPSHASVKNVPSTWSKEDECYFMKEMYPGIKVTLAHDLTSLRKDEEEKMKANAGSFARYYPASWYHTFDGGTIWITTLGHDKKDYEDPTYLNHILQGMQFVALASQKRDETKAYAKEMNEDVR